MIDGYGWGFRVIGMVLCWILVSTALHCSRAGAPQRRGREATGGRAFDILKKRYARWEIDKQENEERKRMLQ